MHLTIIDNIESEVDEVIINFIYSYIGFKNREAKIFLNPHNSDL